MLGHTRRHFSTTESTNLEARRLIREGAKEGTLVTADFQTEGRGRRDRRWVSASSESVLASYILYPKRPMDEWGGLPLLAGLGVARALKEAAGLDALLKWPNDVVVEGKKISGILIESGSGAPAWAIMGIGINVYQKAFEGEYRRPPTSVYMETGSETELFKLIGRLSHALDGLYAAWTEQGNPPIIEAWKQHTRMLGATVRVESAGEEFVAVAEDIAPDGSLVIRREGREPERLYAGDVTLSIGES